MTCMEIMVLILLLAPIASMLIAIIIPSVRCAEYFNLLMSALCLYIAINFVIYLPHDPQTYLTYFYLDKLGAWVAMCTSTVYFLCSFYSIGYLRSYKDGQRARLYYAIFAAFAFVMLFAAVIGNILFYWIGIDLTTIVSTFLVCYKRSPESVEASWKYLVVVVAGLSIALLGILLFQWGSVLVSNNVNSVTWQSLAQSAPLMNGHLLILAFICCVVGFGTKVGLAPMHTWLPDAHSEGPAPASAMLSGALLNTAMLGVVRFVNITSLAGYHTFAHLLLVIFGILSVIVAAFYIGKQKGVKRLMAYSSLEHMGIIGLGFGFGGIYGLTGAMYHMLNHSLNKLIMFFGAGNMIHAFHTQRLDSMRGVLRIFPKSGLIWLLGAVAITGAPPAGLFLSELSIMRGGLLSENRWAAFIMMALLIVIFCSFLTHFRKMYFAKPSLDPTKVHKLNGWFGIPMFLAVIPLFVFGFWWPGPMMDYFMSAAEQLRGIVQ
jgi:hydrogenase-4 component F